jgi:hypothetical protein
LADWGLLAELSVSTNPPLRFPVPVGVKVTLIVQLEFAATDPPQLLVWAKSPLGVMVREVTAKLLLLVTVMDCAALVLETACPP